MDAYALFDALTDVRDGFLEETERRLHGKKRRRVGVYLLAAVLIVLLCFSSAVALDADFRQRVLSLFQVAEVVPTQTSQSVTLADGLQADYVFVPAYARTEGGMFIVCTDEVEMKQGSHYAAYAYESGQLVRQENHRFDQTYTVQGKTCRLMFDWAEHDGRAAITWAPTLDEAERLSPGLWEWRLEGGLTTQYRVKLGSWPVTIDLRTGALTDPLASYDTSQFPEDTFVETWPDEQGRCLLAQLVSTSPYRLTRYYFDGTDVTPLAQLCGGEPSFAYLSGNMLVYWQWADDAPPPGALSAWRIDLDTMERLPVFTDIPATAGYAGEDALLAAGILPVFPEFPNGYPLTPGLVSGGYRRLALKMAEDRTVTLIDTQTSRSIPVEGYTLPDVPEGDIWFCGNPAGTRLLVALRDRDANYNFTHIAVLGMEGGVSLERRSADGVKERYITWLDDDRFIISCSNDDGQYGMTGSWFYIYDLRRPGGTAQPETPDAAEPVSPPAEPADDELVYIRDYIPTILVDLRYATDNNFTGQVIYDFTEPQLRYGTVKKLAQVQEALLAQGYSMKIWDAYRPVSAQFDLWAAYPDALYVADPTRGYSTHSKGNTIDVTLVKADGTEIAMPTDFDDFSALADRDYSDVPEDARANVRILEQAMIDHDFRCYAAEWWHYWDSTAYPVITE